MVKPNYTAWDIDSNRFKSEWSATQKLLFFAEYAVLAPSGHNTQPWQLYAKPDSVLVSINHAHYLSIDGSGLLSVEPYISLGTFLEVFSLAAHGFGIELDVQTFTNKSYAAKVSIKGQVIPEPELLDAIVQRVSNRNPYQPDSVKPDMLKTLMPGKFSGVDALILSNRQDIDFVATETESALPRIMGNPLYRKELSLWVRSNQTRQFDGMPGFTHGFGSIKSILSKAAIRHAPAGGPQAKKSGNLIRKSGALIVVSCQNDNQESFINAGRVYSQICVYAQCADLATSALGASVLDPGTRENIKEHFKLKDRPVYVIRLGKTNHTAQHSPRWPLESVLTQAP